MVIDRSCRSPAASLGLEGKISYYKVKGAAAACIGLLEQLIPFWPVAVLALLLCTAPASAQTPADEEAWTLQGGAYLGPSFAPSGLSPEFAVRFGASSGTRVLDLSVSTFSVQYYVPPIRRWNIEVLAGLAWQPDRLGFGFRSGVRTGLTALGDRWSALVVGPHATLAVPISPVFEVRGETGVHVFDPLNWGFGGLRGYLRVGIEGRKW